jgi:hypothetical protein
MLLLVVGHSFVDQNRVPSLEMDYSFIGLTDLGFVAEDADRRTRGG